MKRFPRLDDPDLNKKYIKQYILVHKTGNEYNFDKSGSQYDYAGEVSDENNNEYLTPYVLNDNQFKLDDYDKHVKINELDIQLYELEETLVNFNANEKTEFRETVNDRNNFSIILNNGKLKGYYSGRLIEDIERKLLDENIVNTIIEKKNEILNNE